MIDVALRHSEPSRLNPSNAHIEGMAVGIVGSRWKRDPTMGPRDDSVKNGLKLPACLGQLVFDTYRGTRNHNPFHQFGLLQIA